MKEREESAGLGQRVAALEAFLAGDGEFVCIHHAYMRMHDASKRIQNIGTYKGHIRDI